MLFFNDRNGIALFRRSAAAELPDGPAPIITTSIFYSAHSTTSFLIYSNYEWSCKFTICFSSAGVSKVA